MGRISFPSKIPPPPPILAAHTHHRRSYNASNASPASFLLLIATVAAGEVLAIFVCKIIADYADMGMHSQDQPRIRASGTKRRSLIDRALVVSQCRRQSSATRSTAGDDEIFANDDDEDGNCCPICLCDLNTDEDDIRRPMSCSHIYHKGCISGWLEQNETCPLCRTNVLYNADDADIVPMAPSGRRFLWTQSTMWGEDR
uniref:RING-type domain-containing protein n=1 Tax=Minutocellus polymorphus TaxID=265543 RepID=A0A7S0AVF0_9STRA|mmetsp:Transcript_442/g.780  ORF Transcript_442/g.780 Transcript_442/m.780 type:complete len:200 (+) Transcript_442:106-705(+)